MRRMLLAGTRAFWINALLLIGMHPLPPIAFFVPIGTGFATGFQIAATRREAVAIASVMGLWMGGMITLIGIGAGILSALKPPGIMAGDPLLLILVASGLIAHLSLFAGAGAMLGGHFARKEQTPTAEQLPA